MEEVRFYGTYGVCGVRVASVIISCIKCAINKYSSKCFSIFYDNTAVNDLLCHGIRILPTWAKCFNGGLTTTVRPSSLTVSHAAHEP